MEASIQRIADDWIAYSRYENVEEAPEQVAADAQSMIELPQDRPELAWDVIKHAVRQYSEEELFSVQKLEAQRVVGMVAAGPLEDVLGFHGSEFIDRIEADAARDRRMAWALGGVWQFMMSDDVWGRVQLAADYTYWQRPAAE